ncbi:MAG: response regulator [Cyanobacteria bacterium P01_F01_bin.150]
MVTDRHVATPTLLIKPMIEVLLVEDNRAEARLLQELLKGSPRNRFHLVHVLRLGDAIARLSEHSFDVILLDLTLPDSVGLQSLQTLLDHVQSLPIVVLTNTNDDELAIDAVRQGAQDYLIKRQVNQDMLVRSLRYAIERKQAAEALREANEILEQRVAERTTELATANALLRSEIQERQRTQERLTLAQTVSKIGTFEWHIPAHVITWSPELESLYGRLPGELRGQFDLWLRTLHEDDRDRVEQEFTQAVNGGEEFSTEFRIVTPLHSIRWISVKSHIFVDKNGAPLRMIGIHMDITDKKDLEAQFLRAQRLESLGTLASGIAHDLNNILTPILGVVQLLPLQLSNLSDRNQLLLDTLNRSARRGAALVKQILSFTRGVEGKRTTLQVNYILREVETLIQQTIPKSIQIHTHISTKVWPVLGDATQLHQVFMNLCVNARDAMADGGTLTISVENCTLDSSKAKQYLDAIAEASYVMVTVQDTGSGMPPDIVDRIFDPFFTTKPIGKGTGLGLSAVLGIIKSHGGFVDVQSEVGEGSCFTIFLPAQHTQVAKDNSPQPLSSGHQELILVVDDEAAILDIAKMMLETYNYRVITAQCGTEAIALFHQHRDELDYVLIDMMMPEPSGVSLMPLIGQLRPDLLCIAMSGLESKNTIETTKQLGFQGFLAKPFTTQDLLLMMQCPRQV